LDVWTRHVTALEDPQLREVALSGPDTTTRTQTVWQVRLLKLEQALAQLDSANLPARLPASTARMAARAKSLPSSREVRCSRRARAICASTITCTASRFIKAVAWAKMR
jgi:hypothetical protein